MILQSLHHHGCGEKIWQNFNFAKFPDLLSLQAWILSQLFGPQLTHLLHPIRTTVALENADLPFFLTQREYHSGR
jgi:hypothetical protein